MVQQSLSNERLFELGRLNYQKLREICEKLSDTGYWEEPEKILHMPIYQMLDTYLQAVLVQISQRANGFTEEETLYMLHIMDSNPYDLALHTVPEENILCAMNRVLKTPPIILQLCGVCDREQKTRLSAIAFDCFVNVVLGIVYLNTGKSNETLKIAEEYYKQISIFLNASEAKVILNQRYWFKKISADRLDLGFFEEISYEYGFQDMKQKQQERIEIMKQDMVHAKEQEEVSGQIEHAKRTEVVKRLDAYLDELNNLIGLKEVKQEVTSLINLIKVKKMREHYNMAVTSMTYHMIFTGNPGTGKTTVARLLAKIYKELGILSKGHLVETDRSGLVAGYVGQTALKVKEVVESAIGGILFIDEAYSLSNQLNGNDFGQEAIDTLVKLMEDNRDDLIVIAAGYKDEMQTFLEANPGLISRFNKFIRFMDYSCQELMDIMDFMSEKDGIVICQEAKDDILNQIENLEEEKRRTFGNARGIRNAFEKILINQANRLVLLEKPTREQLQEVILEDVWQVIC